MNSVFSTQMANEQLFVNALDAYSAQRKNVS